MTKFFFIFITASLLIGCQQGTETDPTGDTRTKELENQVAQLELDNSMKDSVINESLSFFNEIKSNLESIGVRKDQIREISDNPELTPEDKQWILEEIRRINFLREDNARKVRQLSEDLKKNKLEIDELNIMIESLVQEIKWKDEQIDLLQAELSRLDKQYSALFDAYQEQALQIDVLMGKLNMVYFAYGSEKELSQNKIIEKKNGFIGIGKKLELRTDFERDYFQELNSNKAKSLVIHGKKPHFLTDHPTSSYELVDNGASTQIKILDASEFWKISKYLVVIVD